jgi:hypothetical protein
MTGYAKPTRISGSSCPKLRQLSSRQGFRHDRIVRPTIERLMSAVVHLSNRHTIAAVTVRTGVMPNNKVTFVEGISCHLLEDARAMPVIDFGDVKACVVAPLEVDLDHGFGFTGPHAMQVDLDIDWINSTG